MKNEPMSKEDFCEEFDDPDEGHYQSCIEYGRLHARYTAMLEALELIYEKAMTGATFQHFTEIAEIAKTKGLTLIE